MTNQLSPKIPSCTWSRPIGLGWDKPYTVRYASNIDDGPWHGMPLGGLVISMMALGMVCL